MHVAALNVYPVTGARGSAEEIAACIPSGLAWDRYWVLYDPSVPSGENNRVSQNRHNRLATVSTAITSWADTVVVSIPQEPLGSACYNLRLTEDDPDALVYEFGDPVPVVDAGDEVAQGFARLLGLPEVRLGQKSLEWMQDGNHATRNQAPLHIVSSRSVEWVRELTGPQVDVRRFRPNIVIESDGRPFEEHEWIDRVLEFEDGVAIRVDRPTPRCNVPGIDQTTGKNQKDVPRLYRQFPGNKEFGVYAHMISSSATDIGYLSVGQSVSIK